MPSELLKYPVRPEYRGARVKRTVPGGKPAAPSRFPGDLAELPSPPPGVGGQVSEFAYLRGLISGEQPTTLFLSADGDPHLDIAGRYTVNTDDEGTPSHTETGPNLFIHDEVKDLDVLVLRSIGQLQIHMSETHAVLPNNTVSHNLQLHRVRSDGDVAVGFGTGIQVMMPGTDEVKVECGNLQCDLASVTPGALNARWVCKGVIGGTVGTTLWNTTSVGNFLGAFKGLFTGGIGVGNSAAATTLATPETVAKRMEVFDAAGASLGSVAIYPNVAFS